jgi:hypothetical protein
MLPSAIVIVRPCKGLWLSRTFDAGGEFDAAQWRLTKPSMLRGGPRCRFTRPPEPVPEETARVADAAFPAGTPYVLMRDHLAAIYQDSDFTHLFPARGKPAEAPWRLALVTIFQFAEDDRGDRLGAEDAPGEAFGGG